jgi:hypothetical protein
MINYNLYKQLPECDHIANCTHGTVISCVLINARPAGHWAGLLVKNENSAKGID